MSVLFAATASPRAPHPRAKKIPAPPMRCGDSGKKRWAARYFPALLGAVSSPRGPLTAVFGMGTGVSAPPRPPTKGIGKADMKMKELHGAFPPRDGTTAAGREAGKPHGLSERFG